MAAGQAYSAAENPKDVYLNTALDANARQKRLKEATVLHESLHNLTGLSDDELQSLFRLGSAGGSVNITQRLQVAGCAR